MTLCTWIVRDISITGSTTDWLARQAQLHVPGKVIRNSTLRLELPMNGGRPPQTSVLRSILDEWRADTHGASPTGTPADPASASILDKAGTALTGAGIDWSRIDDGFEWSAMLAGHRYHCQATIRGAWLRLQCQVLSMSAASPASRKAFAHYLVELNSRLHGCRASLTDETMTVETILWADELERLLPVALAALHRSVPVAKKGAHWLQRDEVSTRYLAFHCHTKGGESHEHDRRSSGLVPLPRSG